MSAFIHNPEHVISIVASAARLNLGPLKVGRTVYDLTNPAERDALCRLLYMANVQSVNYRYRTYERLAMIRPFGSGDSSLSAAALCKAIDSLEYQSDQRPGWAASLACKLLTQLRNLANFRTVGTRDLDASQTDTYKMADVWAIN